VRVAVADGNRALRHAGVDLPQGIVEAKGTFGLTPAHSGDSHLSRRDRFSGALRRSYLERHHRYRGEAKAGPYWRAEWRGRSQTPRASRARRKSKRAVTGIALPRTVVDTPKAGAQESCLRLRARRWSGDGQHQEFRLKGTASGTDVIARGNSIGSFTADYDWINARTPQSQVSVNAEARNVRAAGFRSGQRRRQAHLPQAQWDAPACRQSGQRSDIYGQTPRSRSTRFATTSSSTM